MTYDETREALVDMFGDAGAFALETSCVTAEDCAKGIDHVMPMILGALEEELSAQGD